MPSSGASFVGTTKPRTSLPRIVAPAFAEARRSSQNPANPKTSFGRMIETKGVVHVADAWRSPATSKNTIQLQPTPSRSRFCRLFCFPKAITAPRGISPGTRKDCCFRADCRLSGVFQPLRDRDYRLGAECSIAQNLHQWFGSPPSIEQDRLV